MAEHGALMGKDGAPPVRSERSSLTSAAPVPLVKDESEAEFECGCRHCCTKPTLVMVLHHSSQITRQNAYTPVASSDHRPQRSHRRALQVEEARKSIQEAAQEAHDMAAAYAAAAKEAQEQIELEAARVKKKGAARLMQRFSHFVSLSRCPRFTVPHTDSLPAAPRGMRARCCDC